MAYATTTEVRAEGADVPDARLRYLIAEATSYIDRLCGWWFEPRAHTFRVDGKGAPTLTLPVPPIALDDVRVGSHPVDPSVWILEGAPVDPSFVAPSLSLTTRAPFPRGHRNVTVAGTFGYTVPDPRRPFGRTPREIRRACVLLVLRWLDPLMDEASWEARTRARLVSERTRDQSYTLAKPEAGGALTGDPEIDALLVPFRRPSPLGAA